METFSFIIEPEDVGERIDTFLGKAIDNVSRSYIQKLIKDGHVRIDGQTLSKKNIKLEEEMEVAIDVPEPEILKVEAEDIPVEIVYEDECLMIVNKPQGMVVHPAPGNYTGTLVNALMYHAENLSSINGVIRPGIVHRIDKDTSGVLMIAKDNQAHNSLAAQLKEKSTKRVYVAIVHGKMKSEEGTISAPIARHPKDRLRMAVVPGGRESVTHYKVIRAFKNYTLVELRLETGRTHQIRVHLTHIGHPLLGDPVYSKKQPKIKHAGQLLHAKMLGFKHPRTGEYMEFDSELPEYFKNIIKKIEAVERG